MRTKKVILSIMGIVILWLVVSGLLEVAKHPKTERIRAAFKDKVRTAYDNFLFNLTVSRKPPLTAIELEQRLKVYLPVPFTSFNQDDWKWFWHLLYGRYPEDASGWPKRQRLLTQQEIQDTLINYYYKPFGSFNQKQWNIFWQYVLKGKVF